MELWGGHECSVNRVGDSYRDQTRLTGHENRFDDLARFASLGVKRLRYPVLWERVAPFSAEEHDWRWSDDRLDEVARLGMQAIVGLLHHGSGPRYTSLIADDFATQFGQYARAVAERYPYVTDWTPINEPLTTARFSALYGFWYPHGRDERLFWGALLNQVDGIRKAMRAIREVNSAARLIQTEDLGEYYSTDALASTAAHFNDRRWATWDLLTGRVTHDHALWNRLDALGFGERLRTIADDPCSPEVIGVNYYPTSERFLDHRIECYSHALPAEGFYDLTAARVLDPPAKGLAELIRQVWDRYHIPVAVTESHLGCSREEQLRWLWQSWRSCKDLESEGIDLEAFTAWALLGNVDWNSLLTKQENHYESGAFDVRNGDARPTAIAQLLTTLGQGAEPTANEFPVIETRGWWQRNIRLEHAPYAWCKSILPPPPKNLAPPLLITGASGTLGQALAAECKARGLPYVLSDRATLPIEKPAQVAAFLDKHQPWAVINAAGWVRVDDAEDHPEQCFRANSVGAAVLSSACAERGIHCTIISSDLVFGGGQRSPYLEQDNPRPLGVYGQSKLRAEELTVGTHPEMLVVRTAAFFSPYDGHNFAMAVEHSLRHEQPFLTSASSTVSPTFLPHLVKACLDLVVDRERGIWHLANEGSVSWLDFGHMIAKAFDLDHSLIRPATDAQLGWRAKRPQYSALGSQRGQMLPSLTDAVARHCQTRQAHGQTIKVPQAV